VGTRSAGYALTADGRIFSWGANTRGQLGTTPRSEVETLASSNGNKSTPTPVVNVPKAVAISAAGDHALALTAAGTVFTWGYNVNDELGLDPMPIIQFKTRMPAAMQYLPFPMRIPSLTGVTAIAAGDDHSLALLSDGTVMGWGTNRFGQVGDGTTELRKAPVPVVGVGNAVGVAAGSRLSAAWLADGTVMTWGFGNMALGRKTIARDTPYPTPTRVEGVADVRQVAVGSTHMIALTASGNVITWGDQMVGEVGHGPAPARLATLSTVNSVTATTGSTMCVLENGTIIALDNVSDRQSSGGGRAGYARAPIVLDVTGLKNPL
jgi:alpha-tubulin suppressor-like RCC1 family protein